MAFNGTEGGVIALSTASDMTSKYRDENPGDTKGHFYGKDILLNLLDQDGCMGIRIYYGIDEDGRKELVLVGADEHENDLTDLVADISCPCPNRCGISNPLNS